ncbi:hypothetical protein [Streptomyces sp. NPDC002994]|uniref:hypothetical protein n=1 Tax=Streptomyces sp. NPDC002994 TaxID=3154441 RepID=UPI0033BBE88C
MRNSGIGGTIRLGAAAAMTAMVLGAAAPMASATEAQHVRNAEQTAAAAGLGAAFTEVGAPPIVEAGLDDRIAELPANRTMGQVVEAMYPGDKDAQSAVLAFLEGKAGSASPHAASGVASANGRMAAASGWGTAWKYTKCVAFVASVFVPGATAFKAIKALGGVKTTAKLLMKAGNSKDFLKIGGGAAAEIIGINGIKDNCF